MLLLLPPFFAVSSFSLIFCCFLFYPLLQSVSQLQHNKNSVLDQLAAGSTKHKDLDNIPTFNASTHTPDMEYQDVTILKHNTIHMRETEEEIVGTSTIPTDTVSCDVTLWFGTFVLFFNNTFAGKAGKKCKQTIIRSLQYGPRMNA